MKKISILSTGSELIQGALLDKNAHYFCNKINEAGGTIYQCAAASDETPEIQNAIEYLLKHSDALIITGGLGPTSDDNTRHAVAAAIQQPLEFNIEAWEHVQDYFTKFNLILSDSNKRQALFPTCAQIIENHRGTADGCKIFINNKWIFMLPGPPNECVPMFENHVLATLQSNDFFQTLERAQWLTLGLSEGTIAPLVDNLVHPLGATTGFRWNYPYLEIKISCETHATLEKAQQTVQKLLENNIVSTDGTDAATQLINRLSTFNKTIYVNGEPTCTTWVEKLNQANLSIKNNHSDLEFNVSVTPSLENPINYSGSLTLFCELKQHQKTLYQNTFKIPNRGPEVFNYLSAYFTWQLCISLRTTQHQAKE